MGNDYNMMWNDCLAIIKDNIAIEAFQTLFLGITPISYENNVLLVKVPSMYYVEHLEKNYASLLQKTLTRVYGNNIKLKYRIGVDKTLDNHKGELNLPSASVKSNRPTNSDDRFVKDPFKNHVFDEEFDSHLNPNYTFENFIEGSCNKLCCVAGNGIAEQPGKNIFNPLLVYGKSGVGKTHLAQAIGHRIKQIHPSKKVLYVSAHTFMTQYSDSARNHETNDFLNFYQALDVLIIDDIQDLSGESKAKTQNILYTIFNHLHLLGKQIIMTSDQSPALLEGMEERLLTRLKWGLNAEITKPDYETRVNILKSKTAAQGIEFSEEVVKYIAQHVTDNVRDLEGVIISILAQSTITNANIDIDLVKNVIGNIVKTTPTVQTVTNIRNIVCDHFKIPVESVLSKSRKKEVVQARHIAMYFAKMLTNDSLSSIGDVIGKRDHATVLHACKTVKDQIDTDKSYKKCVEEINLKLSL